jgi:hypothetical protein
MLLSSSRFQAVGRGCFYLLSSLSQKSRLKQTLRRYNLLGRLCGDSYQGCSTQLGGERMDPSFESTVGVLFPSAGKLPCKSKQQLWGLPDRCSWSKELIPAHTDVNFLSTLIYPPLFSTPSKTAGEWCSAAVRWPSFFLRSKATQLTRRPLVQIPSQTFPLIVQLLAFDPFRSTLLAGLVISVGGLADSLGKASASALLEFLQTRGSTQMDEADQGDSGEKLLDGFADSFRTLLESNAGADRVILPALKVRRTAQSYGWVTSLGREIYRCRTYGRVNRFLARPKNG